MIITFAFEVTNYVEVMEGWPIEADDATFFLEREGNTVRKVCISFYKIGVENAPKITKSSESESTPRIDIGVGGYAALAINRVMTWQTVVSGLQIFSLDFDNYEIRFRPETFDEEDKIQINSFSRTPHGALNSACDFEQIGRAFYVRSIDNSRIESVSHFREGRIAFEAGRYVDSYNNMYLFLETRYCDGKTATQQQVEALSKHIGFCKSLNQAISEYIDYNKSKPAHLAEVFDDKSDLKDKIKSIVLLRGKLRHHSLKSPHRWDPNKQNDYEAAARFLGLVVADIVIQESINDIYAPEPLEKFRYMSVKNGFETKVSLLTRRIERKPSLALDMSYPTTVISSQLCLSIINTALDTCKQSGQLEDTVKLEASQPSNGLEIFTLELGTWCYTTSRSIELKNSESYVRCSFEHFHFGVVTKREFSVPVKISHIGIISAWNFLRMCLSWIDKKDPTTRILSLKLFISKGMDPFLVYRVGPQITS